MPVEKENNKVAEEDNNTSNNDEQTDKNDEQGGPKGLEPTRYGDWEKSGRCVDF